MTNNMIFHKCIRLWTRIGNFFANHPITISCVVVGTLIVAGMSGYSLYQTDQLNQKSTFQNKQRCGGSAPFNDKVKLNCQQLLDRILKSPTDEQLLLLNKLIKEAEAK